MRGRVGGIKELIAMSTPPEFYLQFIFTTFTTVLTAGLGVLVYRMNAQYTKRMEEEKEQRKKALEEEQERKKENAAMKGGILAILRDRIIQTDSHFTEAGEVPVREKENAQKMYRAYHDLGGNDIATASYNHILGLPLVSEEHS